MVKKTITYTDYFGTERTEDFYFNLSRAEVTEMQLSSNGTLADSFMSIVAAKKGAELTELFKSIILKAYGEKSEDGRRFMKSKEISDGFYETEAYSELFMELLFVEGASAEFFNGILPDLNNDPLIKAKLEAIAAQNESKPA